jgi:hypothetical protein
MIRPFETRTVCYGCGDPPHEPGHCGVLTYFTKKPCACTYGKDETATVPVRG